MNSETDCQALDLTMVKSADKGPGEISESEIYQRVLSLYRENFEDEISTAGRKSTRKRQGGSVAPFLAQVDPTTGKFGCPLCHYSTVRTWDLNRHWRIHTGEKPYRCPQCSYSARDSGSVAKHMRKHQVNLPFQCSLCDYSGNTTGALINHMRRHESLGPDVTADASRAAKDAKEAKEAKGLSCPYCHFTGSPVSLASHLKSHQKQLGDMLNRLLFK